MPFDPLAVIDLLYRLDFHQLESWLLRLATFVIFTAMVVKFVISHWPWRHP